MTEEQLEPYEREMASALARLRGGTEQEARETVAAYADVLRRLGRYPSPEDAARGLLRILVKGWSPERWMAHVEKIDGVEAKRKGKALHSEEATVRNGSDLELEVAELRAQVEHLTSSVSKLSHQVLRKGKRAPGL